MAKLSAALRGKVKSWRWLIGALSVVGVAVGVLVGVLPMYTKPAYCEGCQCCYCDRRENGVCIVNDSPSGCIGCVGACAYNDQQPWLPGTCSDGGVGGCGADVVWCRSSDCSAAPVATRNPPTVTPVPTREPPPPPECPPAGEVREWTNLVPPKIGKPDYQPDHPVVIGQDPHQVGFELHLTFDGGRYEYQTQRLEKVCDDQPEPINGTPQPCRTWHYECPIRCTECYDDPLNGAQIRMRLADPTLDWIQGELAARYPGAAPKEGLPRVWQIAGVENRMHYDAWWRYAPGRPDFLSNGPIDPGIHGGKLAVWTKGTPKSAPQLIERPFEVPVFLVDTTIAQ